MTPARTPVLARQRAATRAGLRLVVPLAVPVFRPSAAAVSVVRIGLDRHSAADLRHLEKTLAREFRTRDRELDRAIRGLEDAGRERDLTWTLFAAVGEHRYMSACARTRARVARSKTADPRARLDRVLFDAEDELLGMRLGKVMLVDDDGARWHIVSGYWQPSYLTLAGHLNLKRPLRDLAAPYSSGASIRLTLRAIGGTGTIGVGSESNPSKAHAFTRFVVARR